MANRYCAPKTEVPDYLVRTVIAPSGGLQAGDIVLLDSLASDTDVGAGVSSNYWTFTATQPATANLSRRMAIVINGGFEQLSDGRRPEGQPDFTQYTYQQGEVATVVMLAIGMMFEISTQAITGTPAATNSLHPVDGSNMLTAAASTPSGTHSALTVLKLKNLRAGGNFGAAFINTVIAQVKEPTA